MFEALVLIILVAAIVVLSRRWPDVEAKLFGEHGVIPPHETAEPPRAQTSHTPPRAAESTPTAGGFMQRRELTDEPDVDPVVMQPDVPSFSNVTDSAESPRPESGDRSDVAQATPAAEAPVEAPPAPAPQAPPTPGRHVTGAPAVPSEPAYVDATKGVQENVDDLAKIADQAYRDRDYERAEQACLKILMQEPKNHKYMTRIGQVYQEMGNLEDAKEAFEAAKALDPKNFFVLNRLAEVERQLSDKGGRKAKK